MVFGGGGGGGETFGVGITIDSFRQVGTRPSASEVLYRFSRLHLGHDQGQLIFFIRDGAEGLVCHVVSHQQMLGGV